MHHTSYIIHHTSNLAKHNETGQLGETAAAEFLEQKGWRIVERNWRSGRAEVDIIAWTPEKILVFIEVKTRAGEASGFGGPEQAVDAKKQDMLARAAGVYMESIDYEWEIRFDVIAVMLKHGKVLEIRHVEDAFFPM
ncbi:MAG: YraN family protein [Saprospiraceae bacterium]|nr:YraN family protein [Saprospiraceae bacterium]